MNATEVLGKELALPKLITWLYPGLIKHMASQPF